MISSASCIIGVSMIHTDARSVCQVCERLIGQEPELPLIIGLLRSAMQML